MTRSAAFGATARGKEAVEGAIRPFLGVGDPSTWDFHGFGACRANEGEKADASEEISLDGIERIVIKKGSTPCLSESHQDTIN